MSSWPCLRARRRRPIKFYGSICSGSTRSRSPRSSRRAVASGSGPRAGGAPRDRRALHARTEGPPGVPGPGSGDPAGADRARPGYRVTDDVPLEGFHRSTSAIRSATGSSWSSRPDPWSCRSSVSGRTGCCLRRSTRATRASTFAPSIDATVKPGERAMVPTGVAVAIPDGHAGLVLPRTGLATTRRASRLRTRRA